MTSGDSTGKRANRDQTAKDDRPLAGRTISVSISEPDDLAATGYAPNDINRITIRLSQTLLAAGARLIFGHDWRTDGVMAAIAGMACQYQGGSPTAEPLVQNFLAWPDRPILDDDLLKELDRRRLVSVRPLALSGTKLAPLSQEVKRAFALTQLRQEITQHCDARICLGGRSGTITPVQGFFAGVVEEAYWAIHRQKPLFLGSFLGGVAEEMICYLAEGKAQSTPAVFQLLDGKQEAYHSIESAINGTNAAELPPPDLSPVFDEQKVISNARCSEEEWRLLTQAHDVEVFATYVVAALTPRDRN